jgi:hypothetical protein
MSFASLTFWAATAAASTSLMLGYRSASLSGANLIIALLAFLWVTTWIQRQEKFSGIIFACFAVLAALGALLSIQPTYLVISIVSSLTAWDVFHFQSRARAAGRVDHFLDLERRHLLRLFILDASALILAFTALNLHFNLSFGVAVLLGLLVMIGIGQGVSYLRSIYE